jgi:hypothetical protein
VADDPREPYGRIVNDVRRAFAAEQVEVDDEGRRRQFFIAEWADRAPSQRELDMRIGAAVAVQAVADAELELNELRAEVMKYRAHLPAVLGALRAQVANAPYRAIAKQYSDALMAFRGCGEDVIPRPETDSP